MMAVSNECSPVAQQELVKEEDARVYPINVSSTIGATLDTRYLWKQFDELGTEMIVTRRGRRMFPPVKIELHDLKPSSFYILLMDLVPVDKYRYKYQNSSWVKCFEESCAPTRLYIHPESPALGSYWTDHVISFYKLKLTNNQLDKQGHIIVNSMHRYQPRLHIVESSDIHNLNWDNFNTFVFPGTEFTTVTAYQNDKITQLKIDNNPFAKGFRESRMRPTKPLYKTSSGSSVSDSGCADKPLLCNAVATTRGTIKRSSTASEDSATICSPPLKKVVYDNDGPIQVTAQENPALMRDSPALTPVYMVNAGRDGQAILTQFSPQNLLRSSQSISGHVLSPPQMVLSSSPQYGPVQQLVSLVQRTDSPSPQLVKLMEPDALVTSPLLPKLKHTSSSGSSSDSTSEDSDNEENHGMGTSPSPGTGTSPRISPPPLQSINPLSVVPQQGILIPQAMQHILVPVAPKQHMFLQPACIGSNNSILQVAYPEGQLKMMQQPVLINKPTSTQQSLQLVSIANTPATHIRQLH